MKVDKSALQPIFCAECGTVLGYTAPGEAARIPIRFFVLCEYCRDLPSVLSDRQKDLLLTARMLHGQTGRVPSQGELAKEMNISRSRVQCLITSVRVKTLSEQDDALYKAHIKIASPSVTIKSRPRLDSLSD